VLAGPSGTDIDISHRRDKSPGGEVLLIEGRVFLPGLFLFYYLYWYLVIVNKITK